MARSGARIAAGTSHHGWPSAPKAISAPARRTRPSRPSHRRGAPVTTPSAGETVPALGTDLLGGVRDRWHVAADAVYLLDGQGEPEADGHGGAFLPRMAASLVARPYSRFGCSVCRFISQPVAAGAAFPASPVQ